MTVAVVTRSRWCSPSLLAMAATLALLNPLPASAQGSSRFDSMFDDARQFLNQQLKKLVDNPPQRGAVRSSTVPLPPRNPRRPIGLAEPKSLPVQPVKPIQPAEPNQETAEADKKTLPPEPVRPREPGRPAGDSKPSAIPPQPAGRVEPKEPTRDAQRPKATAPDPAERPEPREPADPAEASDSTATKPQDAEDSHQIASTEPTPDVPIRNPARTGEYKPPPPHPSEIKAPDWTEKQIAEAKARCDKLLSDEILNFEKLEPIRTGICGTPAPVKLTSFEAGTTVKIAPVATLTCPLAAALRRWMKDVVQPAAKEHLGSPIASIRNVASYACRNRYGGARRPLSEHAKVNAIDIAAFKTESGETVVLAQHWGLMIEPEPQTTSSISEKSEEDGSDTADAPKDGGDDGGAEAKAASEDVDANAPADPAEKTAKVEEGSNPEKVVDAKSEDEEPPVPMAKPKPHPKSLFLRVVHDGACGIFGTVLGPESNAAHRDHFHFDGAERRKPYCE